MVILSWFSVSNFAQTWQLYFRLQDVEQVISGQVVLLKKEICQLIRKNYLSRLVADNNSVRSLLQDA